ncbi:ABC-2 type transport system permease protein [Oceanotoga teriensis]|uniref:Transport permease protein n=1 Tax=Oceanotoga teriensis TaxID=515440 RepID=A0AA45HIW7_9BACT|nr:ABC transporter permease [Oceanotoga teriensis]PWJ95382.1 ABC-2 type transport system permease protein [Oceanotoga teriensis]
MFSIMLRNMKWRFQNPISIIITIIQPLLWLILYSTVASQTMEKINISNYTAFVLPGIMFLVTFSSCSSGGIINFIMKSNGSFYRILISPIKRSSMILGQILEAILLSLLEIFILFFISLFFNVTISSGFIGFLCILVLIFLNAFFLSGLAYFISLKMPNEVIYETIMTLIVLPIFFLSSALFPIDNINGILKSIILFNPFTHFINLIRDLLFSNQIDYNMFFSVVILFSILSILIFLLSIFTLNKEINQ